MTIRLVSVLLFACFAGCKSNWFQEYFSKQHVKTNQPAIGHSPVAQAGGEKTPATRNPVTQASLETMAPPVAGTQIVDLLLQAHRAEVAELDSQAKTLYDQVLALQPSHPHANHRRGVLADKEGNFAEAERYYRAALAQIPNDANLLNDIGISMLLQGRLQESETMVDMALKAQPNNEIALSNRMAFESARRALETGDPDSYQDAKARFAQMTTPDHAELIMQQMFPNGPPLNIQQANGLNPFANSGTDTRTAKNEAPDTNASNKHLQELMATMAAEREKYEARRRQNAFNQETYPESQETPSYKEQPTDRNQRNNRTRGSYNPQYEHESTRTQNPAEMYPDPYSTPVDPRAMPPAQDQQQSVPYRGNYQGETVRGNYQGETVRGNYEQQSLRGERDYVVPGNSEYEIPNRNRVTPAYSERGQLTSERTARQDRGIGNGQQPSEGSAWDQVASPWDEVRRSAAGVGMSVGGMFPVTDKPIHSEQAPRNVMINGQTTVNSPNGSRDYRNHNTQDRQESFADQPVGEPMISPADNLSTSPRTKYSARDRYPAGSNQPNPRTTSPRGRSRQMEITPRNSPDRNRNVSPIDQFEREHGYIEN